MTSETGGGHYRGDAGRWYHESKRGVPEKAVPWVMGLRAEKFAPRVGADDVVLEYGVGSGWNLAGLRCRRKIGFDVSEFLAPAMGALGIEFVNTTSSLPDGVADVVICHHALEHLVDPAAALKEMRRLMKAEGRLLLHVPFERERRYRRFRRDEPNRHLYSWNTQTLGNLVEEAGLRVLKAGIGEFGYARVSAVWAAKLGIGEIGFRVLRRILLTIRPVREVRIVAGKGS
jgi:SAM-dependent methyltransferase